MLTLRPYQVTAVDAIRRAMRNGSRRTLLVSPTGSGKCFGRGTPILMFDGSIKPVESVVPGDMLMGPDSMPRVVTSTCSGREELYKVTPTKGNPYIVNKSHILSLRITNTKDRLSVGDVTYCSGDVANISVTDYFSATKTFRHCAKGWRTGVNFLAKKIDKRLPPYILGLWLGDGTSRLPSVTTADSAIASELNWYSLSLGMSLREESGNGCSTFFISNANRVGIGRGKHVNPMLNALRRYDLIQNKHIPFCYKTNTREVRLEVLAGLLDTDGSLSGGCYDYISKQRQLADDVCFLSRSLGFAAYMRECKKYSQNGTVGTYFRVSISGNIKEIPCRLDRKKSGVRKQKKNVLNVGISIDSIGVGDYFGFEISGPDRLFLLGDFTVVHNTVIFSYITENAASKSNSVWIVVHRQELIDQTDRSLTAIGVDHGVIAAGYRMDFSKNVQVCSVGTLVNRLDMIPRKPALIIWDECHHLAAKSWLKIADANPQAYFLGVTATPERLDGKGLNIVFDTLVQGPRTHELIEQGYLARPTYFCPPTRDIGLDSIAHRGGDFDMKAVGAAMDTPVIYGDAVAHYARICPHAPAISFSPTVYHAEQVAKAFNEAGFKWRVIDGTMKSAERRACIEDLASHAIDGLASCEIINEGTDIPVVTAGIILSPTLSLSKHLQRIGRVLRPIYGCELAANATDADRIDAMRVGPKPRAIILDHVGNISRHGLAEDSREWTLEGGAEKRKKAKDGEPADQICQCPKCYCIHAPAPKCPYCGYEYERKGRDIKQVDGELIQLGAEVGGVSLSGKAFIPCKVCGEAIVEGAEVCPHCGTNFAEKERKESRRAQGIARTMEDLIKVGLARGYPRWKATIWATHVFESREKKEKQK